ncbi:5-(carboxyamino)imidazole ribonucleotide synthase [Commensalibacter papalotli (ex Servin-Garciduenas et al. 2014)]|uniref:N5-carboxyaminoimidazole ribonucleotide synthase n=1 Tax=Commensalibacter papalotli (ex Servin-Garciduenas et al. 2014) TaxID=1208583 RepID=W7DV84_9PROT|nr:5-(carboxyamino)imidazole ribonucleotide synthase [Commensalibacter papalotli (ex Servin-Garciduenas et al. 2014)]EUK18935.1 phosphoribosylaminoimidazole carboxylase ATPase subunit [Commensalibacter papalotli (ex Servin-Garciduenas et al. 2014)]
MLSSNSTIGIVGGGQLGRMSAVAASRLGFQTHILSDIPNAPASQVASKTTIGAYDDPKTLEIFANAVDVITFEFENISAQGIDLLSSIRPVHPSGNILRISQDRILEKSFLNQHNIPTTRWIKIEQPADGECAALNLGYPYILKTTRLGYDGKGQAVIHNLEDFITAFAHLKPHPLIAEKMVDFSCEVSVMVARNIHGVVQTFDVTENRHKNGILDISLAPARILPELQKQAQELAMHIARSLDLIGIMGVELFIDCNNKVLVNEIAPRPHNSGHWTMNACPIDQFEMHIRAVTGLPLPPAIRHSDAVMKNLIGPEDMALWPQILATPELIGHLYGKDIAKKGRKMGHVNVIFPYNSLPGDFGIQAILNGLYSKE